MNTTESPLLRAIGEMKKEFQKRVVPPSVEDTRKKIKKFAVRTDKGLKRLMAKDIPRMAKRLKREGQSLERLVEKRIKKEIVKFTKQLAGHKKELAVLHKTLEKYLKGDSLAPKKKAKKKKVSRKKTSRRKKASGRVQKKS